jgi:hypothetical protein
MALVGDTVHRDGGEQIARGQPWYPVEMAIGDGAEAAVMRVAEGNAKLTRSSSSGRYLAEYQSL